MSISKETLVIAQSRLAVSYCFHLPTEDARSISNGPAQLLKKENNYAGHVLGAIYCSPKNIND